MADDITPVANLAAWLKVLLPKAEAWAKTTLRFLEGPKGTTNRIKSFGPTIRMVMRRVGGVRGGEADAEVKFPKALSETLSWAKKAEASLRKGGSKGDADIVVRGIEEMEWVQGVLPKLDDIENDPNILEG